MQLAQEWRTWFGSEIQKRRTDFFTACGDPGSNAVKRWNKFFVVACLVAIFLDPLFFFLFSVIPELYCITFNVGFAKVVTILRSITDFIYFLHMLLQYSRTSVAAPSQRSRVALFKNFSGLRSWFILDAIAVLPMPQIMLWLVVKRFQATEGNANVVKNILRVTLLLQYVPRCIHFLPLVAGHSQLGFIFKSVWANFAINLFMYVLAGHVVGACWYLFGLQRVNVCLHNVCKAENHSCKEIFLDCGAGMQKKDMSNAQLQWINSTNASFSCLASPTFDYGIYINAVPVAVHPNVTSKYFYSLFWGFLQISTLAGNLVPSLFIWEVFFTMGIIGLGLLLFALLIGNVQNILQSLERRQMDMRQRRYDVEVWMKRRNLPEELKSKVRQAERYKWAVTRGVNEGELLEGLPEGLHKEIRRELILRYSDNQNQDEEKSKHRKPNGGQYSSQMHIFKIMEPDVLDAVGERLHQKVYIEKSVIMRPHYTVERMLFILRGRLLSIGVDGSEVELEEGQFCGEELFISLLKHRSKPGTRTSMRHGVFSTRTVRCTTNVEAFSLEAKDLEILVDRFNHQLKNPKVQGTIRYTSPFYADVAARRIQAAWRKQIRARKRHVGDTWNGR